MAVVRRRPVPSTKDNVKKEEVKAVETTVEETVEPVKETKKPVAKKTTTAKKTESKGEEKMAKATTTKKVATTKKPVATKPATTKKVAEKAPATKTKVIGKNAKKAKVEEKNYEIAEAGSVKRDEIIYFLKDRLANEVELDKDGNVVMEEVNGVQVPKKKYDIELDSLADSARIISCFESILMEALEKSNTVHLGGRNFNRKKVRARVFNPPIGDGAYLVLPHFKMTYVLENSDKIKGEVDAEGNFVAEDGTVYTAEDLVAMDAEFFGEE